MKKIPTQHHCRFREWYKLLFVPKACLILLLSCIVQPGANAAPLKDTILDADYKDCTILMVLEDLKAKTGYTFVHKQNDVSEEIKISASFKRASLEDVLKHVLVGNGYEYSFEGSAIVVSKSRNTQQPEGDLIQVTGRVMDEKGNPLPGAAVTVHGSTTQGTAAGANGEYTIHIKPDGVLVVSFVGYLTETVPVNGRTRMNIPLKPSAENIEEVTVVAFGTQKRESIVGAITSITPMDLKSSNSDLTSSFIGRIAGVIGYQQSGLPVALTEEEMNTKFYIRGITSFQTNANTDPLIILDGVEVSKLDLSRLAPEDIETFSILKDASATAMYGARGANGVFLVTTKKGVEGSVYTTARYETIVSMPTR